MDYYLELKKLSSEIQDILLSPYGVTINREISKKYGLENKQRDQFIDLISDLFLRVLKVDNLESKIISDLKLAPDQAHSLALDIAGLKLLVADDYFKGEILSYLSKNNGDLSSYGKRVVEEKVALDNERKIYAEDIEKPLEPAINKKAEVKKEPKYINLDDPVNGLAYEEDEKRAAVSLFKEDLLDTLNAPEDFDEIIEDYNETLIDLLIDPDFKKDLEMALYSNQEKISEDRITIEDHEVDATVANWLKDFIKTNGSDFFSGVALAQYLSSSANTKKLRPEEKHLVGQVLKLYRNLSFFPDSMGNLTIEKWQIIPFDIEVMKRVAVPSKPSSKTPESLAGKVESKPVLEAKKPELVVKDPLKEVVSKLPDELAELQKEILDYPENSLEHKALQQEIEHYKKSHKGKV